MQKLTSAQLQKNIKAGEIAPVCLLTGEDIFRKLQTVKMIEAVLKPDDFNYVKEDGASAAPVLGEFLSLANTPPVFSVRRLMVLDNADKLKKNALEAFVQYLQNPLPSTCLVLLHNDAKKAKKDKNLEDALSINSVQSSFDELKGLNLANWVENAFKEKGLTTKPSALNLILETVGADLSVLSAEIEKLSLYFLNKETKTVGEEDILASIGLSKEENPFALSNALLDGKRALSLKLVDSMLRSGEEPISVLNKISSCAVKMLRIKKLTQAGFNVYEVVEKGGLMPWESKLASRAGDMPALKNLERALDKVIETDMSFKSSQITDSAVALKGLVLMLTVQG